jgi:uncharacterized small protein (DUF1192 family)
MPTGAHTLPNREAPDHAPTSNAAAQEQLDEHTIFVRGTYSERIAAEEGRYFEPGMMDAANALFGADSSTEVDWYGGPLDAVSREMAGRDLLHDEVLPAFARGEQVNLVGHSHGGNVLGELAASYAHRMDHLRTLLASATGPEGHQAALDAITSLENDRAAERDHLSSLSGRWSIDDPSAHHAQLDEEIARLEAERAALATGDLSGFADELALLENGSFGDVMNLNTPYLARHEAVTEVQPFADRVERFTDVVGTRDPTAALGRLHEGLMGGTSRELPDHPRAERLQWDLEDPGWFDKRRHTGILEEDVFRDQIVERQDR